MKGARLRLPWEQRLHARVAVGLVKLAKASQSAIFVRLGDRVANARSILALFKLAAAPGALIDVEVKGEDEEVVLASITQIAAETATKVDVRFPTTAVKS